MPEDHSSMTSQMIDAMQAGGIDLSHGRNATPLSRSQRQIIGSLPSLFNEAGSGKQAQIERNFLDIFYAATRQICMRGYSHVFLTQSASLSIEFATRLLASRNASIILVEPFLDYMRDILDRNRVRFEACDEDIMFSDKADAFIRQSSAKALFLCSPNNPTGEQISAEHLKQIADACKATGKILLMDTTFRLFDRKPYDQYKILMDSGVSFMVVEDTGKAFPTQEMKVSILACSKDLYGELKNIYSEILLRAPPLHLLLMHRFIRNANKLGFAKTIWRHVDHNRSVLRTAIQETFLKPSKPHSSISVEELEITDPRISAEQVTADLKARGLHVLSGRKFRWSGRQNGDRTIRISLARENRYFAQGISILESYITELTARIGPTPPTSPPAQSKFDTPPGSGSA